MDRDTRSQSNYDSDKSSSVSHKRERSSNSISNSNYSPGKFQNSSLNNNRKRRRVSCDSENDNDDDILKLDPIENCRSPYTNGSISSNCSNQNQNSFSHNNNHNNFKNNHTNNSNNCNSNNNNNNSYKNSNSNHNNISNNQNKNNNNNYKNSNSNHSSNSNNYNYNQNNNYKTSNNHSNNNSNSQNNNYKASNNHSNNNSNNYNNNQNKNNNNNNNNSWYHKNQRYNNGNNKNNNNNNNRPFIPYQQRINDLQERLNQKELQLKESKIDVMNRESDITELKIQHERALLEVEKNHCRKIKEMQLKEIDLIQNQKEETTKLKLALENKRDIISKLRKELEDAQNDILVTRAILETTNNRNVELTGRIVDLIDTKKKIMSNKRIQTDQKMVTVETQVDCLEIDKEPEKFHMSPPQSTVVHSTTKPDQLPDTQNFYSRRSELKDYTDRFNRYDSSDSGVSFARSESIQSHISIENGQRYDSDPVDATKLHLASSSIHRDKQNELLKLIYRKSPKNPVKQNLTINIDGTKSDDYVMVDYIESPDEMPGKGSMEIRSDFNDSRDNLEVSRDYFGDNFRDSSDYEGGVTGDQVELRNNRKNSTNLIENFDNFSNRLKNGYEDSTDGLSRNLTKFGDILEESKQTKTKSTDTCHSSSENSFDLKVNGENETEKNSRDEAIILNDFKEISGKSQESLSRFQEDNLKMSTKSTELYRNNQQQTTDLNQNTKFCHEISKENPTEFESLCKNFEESTKNLLKKFISTEESIESEIDSTKARNISISKDIFKSPAKSYESSPRIHNIPPNSRDSRRSSSDLSKDLSGSTDNLSISSELQDFLNLSETEPTEESQKAAPISAEDFLEFALKFKEKFKQNKIQKAARELLHIPIVPCYTNDIKKSNESVADSSETVNKRNNFPDENNQNNKIINQNEQRSKSPADHKTTNETHNKIDKNNLQLKNGIENNHDEAVSVPSDSIKLENVTDVSENETDIDDYCDSIVRNLIKRESGDESDDENSSISSHYTTSNHGASNDVVKYKNNSTDKILADKNLRVAENIKTEEINFICTADKQSAIELKKQSENGGQCVNESKSISENESGLIIDKSTEISKKCQSSVRADLKDLEETIKILEENSENLVKGQEISRQMQSSSQGNSDKIGGICELIENLTKLAENSSKLAENSSKLTENSSKLAENSSKLAENSSKLPGNSSKLAENSSKLPENSSTLPEDSLKLHENSSKLVENSSKLTENSSKLPENSTKLAENSSKLPENSTKSEQSAAVLKEGSEKITIVARSSEQDVQNSKDSIQNSSKSQQNLTNQEEISTITTQNITKSSKNDTNSPPDSQKIAPNPTSLVQNSPKNIQTPKKSQNSSNSSSFTKSQSYPLQNVLTTPKKFQKFEAYPSYLHSFQDFLTERNFANNPTPKIVEKLKIVNSVESTKVIQQKCQEPFQFPTESSKEDDLKLEAERNKREQVQKEFQQKQHSVKIMKRRESILVDNFRVKRQKIETRSGSKKIQNGKESKIVEESQNLTVGPKNPELEIVKENSIQNGLTFCQQNDVDENLLKNYHLAANNINQLTIYLQNNPVVSSSGLTESSNAPLASNCYLIGNQMYTNSNQLWSSSINTNNHEKVDNCQVGLKYSMDILENNQPESTEGLIKTLESCNQIINQEESNSTEKILSYCTTTTNSHNSADNLKIGQNTAQEIINQPLDVTSIQAANFENKSDKEAQENTSDAVSSEYSSKPDEIQTKTIATNQADSSASQTELNHPTIQAESNNKSDIQTQSTQNLTELTNVESPKSAVDLKIFSLTNSVTHQESQNDSTEHAADHNLNNKSNETDAGKISDSASNSPINLTKPREEFGSLTPEYRESSSSYGRLPTESFAKTHPSPTKNIKSPFKNDPRIPRQLPSEDEMGVCSQIVATTLKKSQQQREMSRSSEERMMQTGNFEGYSRNEQFYGYRNERVDSGFLNERNSCERIERNDRFDRHNQNNNVNFPNFHGNRFFPRDDRNRRNSVHDSVHNRPNISPNNKKFFDRSVSLMSPNFHPKSPKYSRSNSYHEPQFKGPLNSPFRPIKEPSFINDNPNIQHIKNTMASPSLSPPPLMIDENNFKRAQNKNEISQLVIAELTVFYELKKFESDNPKELFKSMARAITYHFHDKNPDIVPNKNIIKNYVMEVFYNYGTIKSEKDFLLSEEYDNDY